MAPTYLAASLNSSLDRLGLKTVRHWDVVTQGDSRAPEATAVVCIVVVVVVVVVIVGGA